jgi:type II secretion system protein C
MDRFAPNGAAADALRARVTAFVARRSKGKRPAASVIRLAEYGLVGAIGTVFGGLFWLGLGPLPEPPAVSVPPPPAIQTASLASANAFRNGSAPAAPTAEELVSGPDLEETTLNLTLHGTWVDAAGGTAIIKTPDEKQGRYKRGDTIWESVTLERVFRDQVVINRDGVRESLRLEGREPGAIPPKAAAAQDVAAQGEVFATLGNFISVAPETDNVGGVNLVLEPGEDYATFLASGLRPGDILVGIDGEPLGRDIGADIEYLKKVAGRNKVTVNVDRGGVVTPIEINLKGLAANGG